MLYYKYSFIYQLIIALICFWWKYRIIIGGHVIEAKVKWRKKMGRRSGNLICSYIVEFEYNNEKLRRDTLIKYELAPQKETCKIIYNPKVKKYVTLKGINYFDILGTLFLIMGILNGILSSQVKF